MGSVPSSMCRHLCCHQAGIVALIAMVTPLVMGRSHHSPGVFAVVAITLLSSSQWHHCHQHAGVVALVTMVSLPSSMHRNLCRCHDGAIALIVLASSSTLHGHCCPCCTAVVVIIMQTSLPSRCMGIVTIVVLALLPPLSWRVCVVMLVLLPLSCCHCCP
jgi:hypothetical protein